LKNNYTIIIIFIGILFLISSCNTIKYVSDKQQLLIKNTITVNDKKDVSDEINDYIIQRPNRLVLGVPVGLNFYNLGNKEYIESFKKWKDSFPNREQFLSKTFSEKQAREYHKFKYNINQWFFKNGESPVILDTLKTKLTANNLLNHFQNNGYFRAKINYNTNFNKSKKANITYNISTGQVFSLDSIARDIKTPVLDSIYELHKNSSYIKSGNQYKYSDFENEVERITKLYRNSGIYHFTGNTIGFKADSLTNSFTTDIKLKIDNRLIESNDSILSVPFKIQKIASVDVYTDYTYNRKDQPYVVSQKYGSINFRAHEILKYNSKLLSNSIFLEPNAIYKDETKDLTRKHLRELQNFRLIDIKYEEINSDSLAAKIYLTPYKKYSFATNLELTHSNIKPLGVSGKLSFLNRNTFKGAEILRFSVQGSFFNSSQDAAANDNNFFNAWEFGGDVSLEMPRILFPIRTEKIIPKRMFPKTVFTIGTSFQKNIGLDKQKFTGILDYNWESSKTKKHKVELLNAQYIKNKNVDEYFNIYRSELTNISSIADEISNTTTIPTDNYDVNGDLIPLTFISYVLDTNNGFQNSYPTEYQTTQNIQKRYDIITEDILVPVLSYEFTFNNSEDFKDNNFSFFRARIRSSGALTSTLAKKIKGEQRKEILGIGVAQYFKTDFEYKKFWGNSTENVLAFRSLLGVAIPYGNSNDIPFSRSYFIGGANDLRAWKIYDLGPGATQNGLEFNVGSLKFLTSLEYRFKIINSIKGAFFMDAGNIWDITDSSLTETTGKFSGLNSLKDIAIGTGAGIRYDFNFLVLRLDLGFKTYEPYQLKSKQWFSNYNFANAVYNIGINYPF
jgi:outer membrane protein assembly factor BamA